VRVARKENSLARTLVYRVRIVRDKHRIPVTKKAIFRFYRRVVGLHGGFITSKR